MLAVQRRRSWLTAQHGLAFFVFAILIATCAAYATRDTAGWTTRSDAPGSAGSDIQAYIRWTRRATVDGIQDIYTRTPTNPPAVYGPVVLYSYHLVGLAYSHLVDPSFDPGPAVQRGGWLVFALKALAVIGHLLAAGAIYFLVRQRTAPTSSLAGIAAGTYAANPAALFAAAHWAQPDGALCLFVVLAVGLLAAGRPRPGWVVMALGALAKPQAWVLLPLMVLGTTRAWGARGLLQGLAVALAAGLMAILPFAVAGNPGAVLAFPVVVSSVDPVISGNAHNIWWIVAAVGRSRPTEILDATPVLGPLTYRTVAAALVFVVFAFASWLYYSRRAGLVEAAALWALGWFAFTTGAHENHLSLAVALLALAWPFRAGLLAPYALLTVTLLLNMALHDQNVLDLFGLGGDDLRQLVVRTALRTLNAVLNLVCFVGWALSAARRAPTQTPHSSAKNVADAEAVTAWSARPR